MRKDDNFVLMRQKPIIFTTVFKVRIADRESTLHTMGGEQTVRVGDYLFEHPDGTVSRVSPENIRNFEEVPEISEVCRFLEGRQ